MPLQYSTDWLTPHLPVWEKTLGHLRGRPGLRVLEVGSFEGRSACWFLDNLLTDPSARLTCIDDFRPADMRRFKEAWPSAEGRMPDGFPTEERFRENIAKTGRADRATILKGRSRDLLRGLPQDAFDVIYLDGSHEPADVLRDLVLSWDLLKQDGILIVDDYLLFAFSAPRESPRIAVDAFLSSFPGEYEVLSLTWQIILRKIPKPAADAPPLARPPEEATALKRTIRLLMRRLRDQG